MEQRTETTRELRESDFPETFVSLGHKNLRHIHTLVYREIAKRILLQFNDKSASGSKYSEEDLISVWAENHEDVEKAHEMRDRVSHNLDYLILAYASYGQPGFFDGLVTGDKESIPVLNEVAKNHKHGCGQYACLCPIREGCERAMSDDQLKRALALAHELRLIDIENRIKEYKIPFWKRGNLSAAQKESSKALKTLKSEGHELMSGEEMQQIIENAANRVLGAT